MIQNINAHIKQLMNVGTKMKGLLQNHELSVDDKESLSQSYAINQMQIENGIKAVKI
jgi:hypothetical protein